MSGKRTKYQHKDIAQLVLTVRSTDQSEAANTADSQSQYHLNNSDNHGSSTAKGDNGSKSVCSKLPRNELLHDDTVLEEIALSGAVSVKPLFLGWVNQCLLIALW